MPLLHLLLAPLDYNSVTETITDSKLELLPLHSPLLRQSSLISFPPLSNMLKFSGCSCLISDAELKAGFTKKPFCLTSVACFRVIRAILSKSLMSVTKFDEESKDSHVHLSWEI